MRVEFTTGSVTNEYFYHIGDTDFESITSLEDSDKALNGGTGIYQSLSASDTSNIRWEIIQDQTFGNSGSLVMDSGIVQKVLWNNKDSVYFSSSSEPFKKVPIGTYSYLEMTGSVLTASQNTWSGPEESVRARLSSSAISTGDRFRVYTSPVVSDKLYHNYKTEVFTLSEGDIKIKFI